MTYEDHTGEETIIMIIRINDEVEHAPHQPNYKNLIDERMLLIEEINDITTMDIVIETDEMSRSHIATIVIINMIQMVPIGNHHLHQRINRNPIMVLIHSAPTQNRNHVETETETQGDRNRNPLDQGHFKCLDRIMVTIHIVMTFPETGPGCLSQLLAV